MDELQIPYGDDDDDGDDPASNIGLLTDNSESVALERKVSGTVGSFRLEKPLNF